MKNKNLIVASSIIALLVASCSSSAPAATATLLDPGTAVALAWTQVYKDQTANAPTATATLPPPTSTPRPTITPTLPPQPIVLSGSGDSVLEINKWNSAGLFKATYTGEHNFIVENFDAAGNQIDVLINTIGAYSGSKLIDVYDNDLTARIAIHASGPWEIQILPLSSVRSVLVPGVVQGVGDDVVLLAHAAGKTDLFKADASQASHNFIVYGLSNTDFYLMFNEIAPYTGTVISDGDTVLIQVSATGPWSIEVTSK